MFYYGNVLSNAAKFTHTGGSIHMITTQQSVGEDMIATRIEITDTGIGMSEEFQKKIFDSFTQERNKNSASQKGTGLGMSISCRIMKLIGGSISVKSKLGKGSTFVIEFTSRISHEKPVFVPEAEQETGKKEPLNILVAEDNELNAEILLEILEMEGFQVTRARNGAEAVRCFQESEEHGYDVILTHGQISGLTDRNHI